MDINGNVLITGEFRGKSTFGDTTFNTESGYHMFLAKYDSDGRSLWAVKGGGYGDSVGFGVAVDKKGSIYLTGCFDESAKFGTIELIGGERGNSMFLIKYNEYGETLWSVRAISTVSAGGHDLVVDRNGDICLIGHFYGTVDFAHSSLASLSSNTDGDTFIAKYDSLGKEIWVKKMGSTVEIGGSSLCVDSDDNIIITGHFKGTVTFGPDVLVSSGIYYDMFLAKCDSLGNEIWAIKPTKTTEAGGSGVVADSNSNVYVTGHFYDTITFGEASFKSSGLNDMFLIKFDEFGQIEWAVKGGGKGADNGDAIGLDRNEIIYIMGGFTKGATFGTTILDTKERGNLYLAKYRQKSS